MSYVKRIILAVTFGILAGVIYALSVPWYLISNGHTYYYFNWFTVSDYDKDGYKIDSFAFQGNSSVKVMFAISFIFMFMALVSSVLSAICSIYLLLRKSVHINRMSCLTSSLTLSFLFVAFFQFFRVTESFSSDDFLDCQENFNDAPETFCTTMIGEYFQNEENIWRWYPLEGYWMCVVVIIAESIVLLLNLFYYYKSFIASKISEDNGFLLFFENIKRIRRVSRPRKTSSISTNNKYRRIVINEMQHSVSDLLLSGSIPKFSLSDLSQAKKSAPKGTIKIGTSRLSTSNIDSYINGMNVNTLTLPTETKKMTTTAATTTTTTTTTTSTTAIATPKPLVSLRISTSNPIPISNNTEKMELGSSSSNGSNDSFGKNNPNQLFSVSIGIDSKYGSSLFDKDDLFIPVIPPPPPPLPSTSYLRIGKYLDLNYDLDKDENNNIGYQGESLI